MIKNPWFSAPSAATAPRVRLVCLPHAGGGVAIFHPWRKQMPPDVELCAVQLPGRDARYQEPLNTDLLDVAGQLADALATAPPARALAIYGHSMGALMAFELARALGRRGLRPDLVAVSGRAAPHRMASPADQLHGLPDAVFIEKLGQRYGGIPQALLDAPDLLAFFLPILRADLRAVETYRHVPQAPHDWPLMVYGGMDDRSVAPADLDEWARHTSGPFRVQTLPGDHFFHQTQAALFVPRLLEDLRRWCATGR